MHVNVSSRFKSCHLSIHIRRAYSQASAKEWYCNSKSLAYVLRVESLVALLDVEKCPLYALHFVAYFFGFAPLQPFQQHMHPIM